MAKTKTDHWIAGSINPAHKGDFAAAAKRAGMTSLQYGEYVKSHKGKFTKLRRSQANEAVNLIRLHK